MSRAGKFDYYFREVRAMAEKKDKEQQPREPVQPSKRPGPPIRPQGDVDQPSKNPPPPDPPSGGG